MFKTRFISMLVLLAAVVTGAWAETIDLSTLTADYEAQNGDVLTGTLAANVKITIADGATVTLSGAVINGTNSSSWAGLTLAGDGTIILSGENTVKGFYEDYPGIFVPANKTLTIQGDGSLTASSNGYGAGIGSGYGKASGNITIEGGTINAQGGTNAAGIGGSYNTSCGNISITGGTVTATGGNFAAGIGSGNSGSSCGNITITDGVTNVTATAGLIAPNSIGAGMGGSCGTVTIGGTVYPDGISDSPFTYDGTPEPAASTYTVTLKEGTEDATSWTITPAEATTTGVAAGTEVKATYSGTKKVKGVKAVKKAPAAPALNITSPAVGQVIGSDGKNYAADATLPDGVTKVAMIAYVDGTGTSLAIALADEGSMNWATAKSTCEAKTPAFTGGTWKLPTQAEWKQMFSANGGSETSYSGLNTAIGNAGGTALQEYVAYWSSTENGSDNAYGMFLEDGNAYFGSDSKVLGNRVRACLAFTVEAPAGPTYPLLSAATTEDYGKVVCAAGHLHDAKTAVPAGCTAVGILGKVTDTGHGLILALQDAASQDWNTINSWASVTDYAGTTLKVLPDDAARGSLTSYTTLGSTAVSNWAVAQKSDYEAIFTNLGSTMYSDGTTYDGNVNAFITEGVGGTAIAGYCWSATEVDGWPWFFYSNYWGDSGKTNPRNVRPVLGFGGEAAPAEPAEPTLADVFTDGAVVGVAVKNTYNTYTVTGTYSGGSYTSYTKSSNDIQEVTMTKDGNNLVVWIKSVMNSECTLTFNTQDNTYTKSFKAGTGAAVWDLSEFVSITVNGTDITSTLTDVTPAAAETTVTWTSSDMSSNFYAYFDGWTYNNTHQGITVTASGDAQGGWSRNGIDVNEGSGTITFTSSVGNIKSIVITADNMNEIDERSAPTGWTANNPWDNPPRTLSWSGTASASVNLPLSEGQNISGISTIVFTLE